MKSEAEGTIKRTGSIVRFDPRDIIKEMVRVQELTEDLWQEFLETNPNKKDLCFAICRAVPARERSWQELLIRGPDKEDLLYLFDNLRNIKFLNYYVWEALNKREDLTRRDLERVLESKRIDCVTAKEAKRMMLRFPKEKDPANEEPDKNPIPEKTGLTQAKNDFFVKKKKRQNPPWSRDYRDPMCG